MKWSKEAEDAVSRAPFFVRRRVKRRVEEEAACCNANEVTIKHVRACQERFLTSMEQEVKGYEVETCFGDVGCPNRAVDEDLSPDLEGLLARASLRHFLKSKAIGPLKMHHEFRVTVADCPNACSRPQIVDVGIVGALQPTTTGEECSRCGACREACKETAVEVLEDDPGPVVNMSACVACGQCVRACPTGALDCGARGWRILLGGKLGRHPQLATELPGIYSAEEVVDIVRACVEHFKKHNTTGERFGDILNRTGLDFLRAKISVAKKNTKLPGA
jgi:anaerobic sulfite reductase subunit C